MTGGRFGVWVLNGEPRGAAALEGAGFDWLVLDMQHGHFDDAAVRATLALRSERRVPLLVRPRANDAGLIGRILDAGADGIVVPLVESASEAEAAVAAATYPPRGHRSWGPLPGLERGDERSRKPFVAVMVETRAGLADVDAIARTPDLDLVFVGPFDLSLSLGTTVDDVLDDTTDGNPLDRILAACAERGVAAGAFGPTVDRARRFAARGFTWLITALDSDVLAAGGAIADSARA